MNDDDTILQSLKSYRIPASPKLDARIHRATAAVTASRNITGHRWWRRAGKMAVAAALAWLLFAGRQPRSIAWADVVDRFASADFVQISLYLADSRSHSPVQVQFWINSEGQAKLRCFNQVVWARQGQVQAVHEDDVPSDHPIHPAIEAVLGQLPTAGGMCLDTLIEVLSQGTVRDVTHTLALEGSIARDLAVFEGPANLHQGQVRLYALRESRLPIGFNVTESSSGARYEAFLTYPPAPDASFFHPDTL
jgi:hypothetical protein